TILDMVGAEPRTVDGESLVPLLKQQGDLKRDAIYWHYPHYSNHLQPPYSAIRQGDYKLIECFEDGRLLLYNLKDDLGEKNNLAKAMPEKVKELHQKLIAWRKSVDAQMPSPNPDYDPAKTRWNRRQGQIESIYNTR
ncbi:MAG: DUF4976 domain-containing protein, partial [Pirellulales bacterium]|nr:DUF4976 domain-containing protein [Pirellulales bacterium]